ATPLAAGRGSVHAETVEDSLRDGGDRTRNPAPTPISDSGRGAAPTRSRGGRPARIVAAGSHTGPDGNRRTPPVLPDRAGRQSGAPPGNVGATGPGIRACANSWGDECRWQRIWRPARAPPRGRPF